VRVRASVPRRFMLLLPLSCELTYLLYAAYHNTPSTHYTHLSSGKGSNQ
jgi:hypothetical protein